MIVFFKEPLSPTYEQAERHNDNIQGENDGNNKIVHKLSLPEGFMFLHFFIKLSADQDKIS
ncbi:MAG: hypothetical protein MRY83_05440 [Flavobacteriales bacterium]|nr:hypothetical protein [Flavobacteriales bacterium]